MNALVGIVHFIDRANDIIGRGIAWLTLAMVLITFAVVVLRYVFSVGFVWMQESYVWLHGVVFMVGAGYTLLHEGHVRVDIFYRDGNPRFKAGINLFGSLVLLLPVIIMTWIVAWPYVLSSWGRFEESREADGLSGVFVLKSVILVFCMALGLQGVSLALRSVLVLLGRTEFAGVDRAIDGEI